MSFKSSHTAASAALETMNAGREVDRGSHRPRPRTPTAATSISSMEPLWLRRGSSTYAEPKCSRRTASTNTTHALLSPDPETLPMGEVSRTATGEFLGTNGFQGPPTVAPYAP